MTRNNFIWVQSCACLLGVILLFALHGPGDVIQWTVHYRSLNTNHNGKHQIQHPSYNNQRILPHLDEITNTAVITDRHDRDPLELDAENPLHLPEFTQSPSSNPSLIPTSVPSKRTTNVPTLVSSSDIAHYEILSNVPSIEPTIVPTRDPTNMPSIQPTLTFMPSTFPSIMPIFSFSPSKSPTDTPSLKHTQIPTTNPSIQPTSHPLCLLDNGFYGLTSTNLVIVPYLYDVETYTNTPLTQEQTIELIEMKLGDLLVSDLWEKCAALSLNVIESYSLRRSKMTVFEKIEQKQPLIENLVGFQNRPKDIIDTTSQCQDTQSNACVRVIGQLTLYTQNPFSNNAISQTQTLIQSSMTSNNKSLYIHPSIVQITYIDLNGFDETLISDIQEANQINIKSMNYLWVIAPASFSVISMILLFAIRQYRHQQQQLTYTRDNFLKNSMYQKYDMRSMLQPYDDCDNDTTMNTSYTATTYDDGNLDIEVMLDGECTKFREMCFDMENMVCDCGERSEF